jgi:hypothetical protein
MQRGGTQPIQGSEGLEAGRHLGRTVGVNRSGPTIMSGVESGQKIDDLSTPHLSDDDAVRAHPQRLADQVAQRDLPCPLDVRAAGDQPHEVRVTWR